MGEETVEDILAAVDRIVQREESRAGMQRRRYADVYAVAFDAAAASRAAGYPRTRTPLWRGLAVEVKQRLAEYAARSALDADYARQLVLDAAEFCPLDYFTPSPAGDGTWEANDQQLRDLPHRYRRLLSVVPAGAGAPGYRVTFVPKAHTLALAARYSLTEKHEATVVAIPWDRLVGDHEPSVEDEVSRLLRTPPGEVDRAGTRLEPGAPRSGAGGEPQVPPEEAHESNGREDPPLLPGGQQ